MDVKTKPFLEDRVRMRFRLGRPLPEKIVTLRALQLGDLLCAVPAWRALRAALPQAQITLVGLPWARQFVARFSNYLDGFIEFPGFPGFPERLPMLRAIPSFLERIQEEHFDLAIQMQGSGEISNPLIALFGARACAGFWLNGQYCPDLARFMEYPCQLPEVHRYLALTEFLGLPSQGDHLEFPILPSDRGDFDLLAGYGLEAGHIAVIHPGARHAARRWPPEGFAQVADGLAGRGLQIVLTGSIEESALTEEVAKNMRFPAIDLAGKTSLGALAVLLSQARLLVCNDTGVSHLADALHVPSVILFSASDPRRWAPLNRRLHRAITHAKTASPQVVLARAEQALNCEEALA